MYLLCVVTEGDVGDMFHCDFVGYDVLKIFYVEVEFVVEISDRKDMGWYRI